MNSIKVTSAIGVDNARKAFDSQKPIDLFGSKFMVHCVDVHMSPYEMLYALVYFTEVIPLNK